MIPALMDNWLDVLSGMAMIDSDDCENGELATDSQILLGWRLMVFFASIQSPKTENMKHLMPSRPLRCTVSLPDPRL